jgi:hypothetical protein
MLIGAVSRHSVSKAFRWRQMLLLARILEGFGRVLHLPHTFGELSMVRVLCCSSQAQDKGQNRTAASALTSQPAKNTPSPSSTRASAAQPAKAWPAHEGGRSAWPRQHPQALQHLHDRSAHDFQPPCGKGDVVRQIPDMTWRVRSFRIPHSQTSSQGAPTMVSGDEGREEG